MSLSVDGVWKAGVWASTVWAAGVWREGAAQEQDTHDGFITVVPLRRRREIPRRRAPEDLPEPQTSAPEKAPEPAPIRRPEIAAKPKRDLVLVPRSQFDVAWVSEQLRESDEEAAVLLLLLNE